MCASKTSWPLALYSEKYGSDPPSHEHVLVGQLLNVALTAGRERGRVLVLRDRADRARAAAQGEHQAARLRVHFRHRAVVEHADRAVRQRRRVVLVGGARAGAELGRGVLAADLHAEAAADGVQQVHRPRVARGDQRRAVGALVDRVDVEVVERPLRACAGRRGCRSRRAGRGRCCATRAGRATCAGRFPERCCRSRRRRWGRRRPTDCSRSGRTRSAARCPAASA